MTNLFVRIRGMNRHMPADERTEFVESLFADFLKPDEMVIKHIVDRQFSGFRNFCFVEIENEEKALEAVEALDDTSFGGCTIIVNVARPREFSKSDDEVKNNIKSFKKAEVKIESPVTQ